MSSVGLAKADITPRRVALLAWKYLCDRSRPQRTAFDLSRIRFGNVVGNSVSRSVLFNVRAEAHRRENSVAAAGDCPALPLAIG